MRIAIALPHAAWHPHRSGYPSNLRPQEYDVGSLIAGELAPMLAGLGHSVDVLEIDKRFECSASGCPGAVSETRKRRCRRYRAGLADLVIRAATYDLAIQMHVNKSKHSRGALCITSGTDAADSWASTFLSELGRHIAAERVHGVHFGGVLPITDDDVRSLYGRKAFVLDGAEHAVLAELGNVLDDDDAAWLMSDDALEHIAEAASTATQRVFVPDNEEVDL